jgi:hypothetical protein
VVRRTKNGMNFAAARASSGRASRILNMRSSPAAMSSFRA